MTEGSPGFSPPADCGSEDDHGPREKLWEAVKKAPDLLHHGYVVFGGDIMGFKGSYNGLLVPKERIKGIECPKVVAAGAQNFWTSAWEKARGLNLPEPRTLVSVNSMTGRTEDQLHFHLTVLKKEVREQLDKLSASSLKIDNWNNGRHILFATDGKNDDTYVYRIAHVDNLDTNPFTLLDKYVAKRVDAKVGPYDDRFDQSLAIVKGPNGAGFYLIATQGQPSQKTHGQPVHLPDLDLVDKTSGKRYFGTTTAEALIDRDWKPV